MSDKITMGTLFSGIGAPEVAAADLGIVVKWQSEIDPQSSAVLSTRFPDAINLGDVRNVGKHNAEPVDILVGGFPCQDLSVAGLRGGLAGERSGLWYEFHRVIFEVKPRIVIIENVDGLLSSGLKSADGKHRRGIDFAIVLAGLAGVIPTIPDGGWKRAGFMRGRSGFYNVAWRVLDAQFFGVPQRRKRIFIVASLGGGSSAEILFERASLSGGFRPSRKTRKGDPALLDDSPQDSGGGVAGTIKGGSGKRGYPDPSDGNGGGAGRTGNERNEVEFLILNPEVAKPLLGSKKGHRFNADETLVFDRQQITSPDNRSRVEPGQPAGTLSPHSELMIAFRDPGQYVSEIVSEDTPIIFNVGNIAREGGGRPDTKIVPTLNAKMGDHLPSLARHNKVRRLTPIECERLQGFPVGWTAVVTNKRRKLKMGELEHYKSHHPDLTDEEICRIAPDSARYKQLGNSMAVPVMRWILGRTKQILDKRKEA